VDLDGLPADIRAIWRDRLFNSVPGKYADAPEAPGRTKIVPDAWVAAKRKHPGQVVVFDRDHDV